MKYLLDTNIIEDYLFDKYPTVKRIRHALYDGHEIKIDGMAYFEKKRGLLDDNKHDKIEKLERIIKNIGGIELYDEKNIFENAAHKWSYLRGIGNDPGGGADCLIGAVAEINDYIVVTNNARDFDPMKNVQNEDWSV